MRLTPLEITSHSFARRFRGLDAEEVERFLSMVADDYESVMRENDLLRTKVAQLEGDNRKLQKQEELLKVTLVNAQSISEKMKLTAERECNALLGEAEIRAEKIVDASHRRAARIAGDIRDLKSLRSRLAESLRGSLDIQRSLIDSIETDPEFDTLIEGGLDAKIAYLRAQNAGSDSTVSPRSPQTGPGTDEDFQMGPERSDEAGPEADRPSHAAARPATAGESPAPGAHRARRRPRDPGVYSPPPLGGA